MSCYRPKTIKHSPKKNNINYKPEIQVPCGRCVGCERDNAKRWCQRMVHEAKLYELGYGSCMVTLTYDDKHVPTNKHGCMTLKKIHLQNFVKRLRYYYPERKIRYFGCGEYGSKTERPHYHIVLFNISFREDKYVLPVQYNYDAAKFFTKGQDKLLYGSHVLKKAWTDGNSSITLFSPALAMYVAKYVVKDAVMWRKREEYKGMREPMFGIMSLKPGLGADYYKRYKDQWFDLDIVTVGGMKMKPHRYYEKLLDREDPERLEKVKKARLEKLKQDEEQRNNSSEMFREQNYYTIKRKRETRSQ